MTTLRRIDTERDRYARDCVTVLREMLERAEAGEFQTVVVVAEKADGSNDIAYRRSAVLDFTTLIGRISILRALLERAALGE